jgi:hypothetical protein
MNDRCTPATARRLQAQGFPKPVPEPGQVWYTANDTPFIIVSIGAIIVGHMDIGWPDGEVPFGTPPLSSLESCAYAPTATDILRELGYEYRLSNSVFRGGWICEKEYPDIFANENPAEACAMAWEAKQKRG